MFPGQKEISSVRPAGALEEEAVLLVRSEEKGKVLNCHMPFRTKQNNSVTAPRPPASPPSHQLWLSAGQTQGREPSWGQQ